MFPCVACKAKDDEIKHLRAIVDSILVGKGLAPVVKETAGPAQLDEVNILDVQEDNNITRHGGDV